MVIFARAWFSDSEMNFNLMPGFAFSNSDDSFWASVICELDTKAMVTSLSDAPRLPAPEQPAVSSRPAATAHTESFRSALVALIFTPLLVEKIVVSSTDPKANVHTRCRIPIVLPARPSTQRGSLRAWAAHCTPGLSWRTCGRP